MQEQDSNLFSEVSIDEAAKSNIAGIASWAMIIVVTTVIGYVLNLVGLFTSSDQVVQREGIASYMTLGGDGPAGTIISIIIGLVINYFLYRFASLSRSSLASHNQEQLTNSFRNLKIYFILTTVLMILIFLIALLAIVAVA